MIGRRILFLLPLMLFFLASSAVDGAPRSSQKTAKKSAKKSVKKSSARKSGKSKITVPVDVGVGPTFNHFFGTLSDDQFVNYGLKFDVAAIITKEVIKQNQSRIPKKYRKQALKMDELRYSPLWWLPDSVFISPKLDKMGVYGITFRPISLGLSLLKTDFLRFSVSAGAVLTYAYIVSDEFKHGDSMHFLRPGVDARAEFTLKFTQSFLISFGWDSYFYVPQPVDQEGKGIFDLGGMDNSLWHNGQGFVMLHFRFPYSTSL